MFSHIMIGANDIEVSKAFYDATLGALGMAPGFVDDKGRCFYRTESGMFALTKPLNGEVATGANGGTIGFTASSTEAIDAWHVAGLAHGGKTCEDPPGFREGANTFYRAYLLDPAGNKICAIQL